METKPGVKTTEFWVTIGSMGLSFVGMLGYLAPVDVAQATEGLIQIGSGVAMVVGAFGYTISRGIAKTGIKPD